MAKYDPTWAKYDQSLRGNGKTFERTCKALFSALEERRECQSREGLLREGHKDRRSIRLCNGLRDVASGLCQVKRCCLPLLRGFSGPGTYHQVVFERTLSDPRDNIHIDVYDVSHIVQARGHLLRSWKSKGPTSVPLNWFILTRLMNP